MGNSIVLTIFNSIVFAILVAGLIYLFVGAFLNARREIKGKSKVKRTSMIIFVLVSMVLLGGVMSYVNYSYYSSIPTYDLVYHFGEPKRYAQFEDKSYESGEKCIADAKGYKSDIPGVYFACGKNCDRSDWPNAKCEEIFE